MTGQANGMTPITKSDAQAEFAATIVLDAIKAVDKATSELRQAVNSLYSDRVTRLMWHLGQDPEEARGEVMRRNGLEITNGNGHDS